MIANRDLSDRITYTERHSLESKNFEEMVRHRKTINEKSVEIEALTKSYV